jgi:diadenosine tetraphosphate (Ap4A) HIT family hydrolase
MSLQEKLIQYILRERIKDSSTWVPLRYLFIFAKADGKVSFARMADGFYSYYHKRLEVGLQVDKADSKIASLKHFTTESTKHLLREELLPELIQKGFLVVSQDDGKEYVGFKNSIWESLIPTEKAKLLAEIDIKLENYFTNDVPHPAGILPLPCVFCHREHLKIVKENDLAYSVYDIFPAVPGHCLIIPKRHTRDIFGLTTEEMGAMLELLKEMKLLLDEEFGPDGFNIGFNVDYAAGQTVMHAHMHCFPRKWGDVASPRGGLRNIIPNWMKAPKD